MLTEEERRQGKEAFDAWKRERERMKTLTPEERRKDDSGFKAWLAWKKIEPKIKTHGAEEVPLDSPLYDVQYAVKKVCLDWGGFPLPLYFTPEDLVEKHPEAAAMYGYGVILFRKDYYQEHGTDEAVINTMFHELIHAVCNMPVPEKRIKDTEGAYHLPAFKEACEARGGICTFADSESGYSNARVTPESLEKIRGEMRAIEARRKRA